MLDNALHLDTPREVPAGVFQISEIAPLTGTAAITLFAGTTVLTLRGEVAVETLIPGDRIITRDTGMVMLHDLVISRASLPAIRVVADSFGQARPQRDTLLVTDALVNLRNWCIYQPSGSRTAQIIAMALVDGQSVTPQGTADRLTCTLVFDRPHVIYADGLELCAI